MSYFDKQTYLTNDVAYLGVKGWRVKIIEPYTNPPAELIYLPVDTPAALVAETLLEQSSPMACFEHESGEADWLLVLPDVSDLNQLVQRDGRSANLRQAITSAHRSAVGKHSKVRKK